MGSQNIVEVLIGNEAQGSTSWSFINKMPNCSWREKFLTFI